MLLLGAFMLFTMLRCCIKHGHTYCQMLGLSACRPPSSGRSMAMLTLRAWRTCLKTKRHWARYVHMLHQHDAGVRVYNPPSALLSHQIQEHTALL